LGEAIACLVRATELDPTDPEGGGTLGDADYIKGDRLAANAAFERFLAFARPDGSTVENVEKYLRRPLGPCRALRG
jgi:hypothetical protein